MRMRGRGLNAQAVVESVSHVAFGALLFWLAASGACLDYVTPRMRPYLYGLAALMILWGAAEGRKALSPRYKNRMSRSMVLVIPAALLVLLPLSRAGGSTPDSSAWLPVSGSTWPGGGSASPGGENGMSGSAVSGEDDGRPWYDLNGLDREARTITIEDRDFYTWMYELSYFYQEYEGYTVTMKGFVYRDPGLEQEGDFLLVRLSMWCCAADVSPLGVWVNYDGAEDLPDGEWVTCAGTIGAGPGGTSLLLRAQSAKPAEKPEVEYVYPQF